ncbi:MAG: bifunctional folylpolyglutamate synthase/dihydrofolate synthase [Hyphomicrobiaceae bacterium]|nr:bifunctional folylpolyglutamate synthase/dihydrofolate synthase [Hyphomicrobiaceae bacterium]
MTTTSPALAAALAKIRNLHPVSIDLSLGRIIELLEKLGRPQDRLPPVLHVAGTNGKGSTTAYLRAMLEADGRRVHVYTSPHLVRFNERIRVAKSEGGATPIDDARLIAVLERVSTANGDAPITYFEIITAAALLVFAEQPADALVLEVGLGGRLDATNVVARPAVTIITPVSMDHREMLGETIELIATEKAGILKSGVPAIVGPQPEAAMAAIRSRAEIVGAPLTVWGEDFDAYEQNGRLVCQVSDRLLDLPLPGLFGRHQIVNAGVSVAAALALGAPQISEDAIAQGLTTVLWPARFTRLDAGALVSAAGELTEVWLDGGHNAAAGQILAQALGDLDERSPKPAFLIVGMMRRKDAENFLMPFAGLVRGIVTVPLVGHETDAYDPYDLAGLAEDLGFEALDEDDLLAAVGAIEAWHVGPKRILICGSLYLAGQLLADYPGSAPRAEAALAG